ncbi:arrestin domain-containing protein 17-like isoform X2 [Prorops nasuta]|uniref:arrestin domain-containing protein 17-like isoform X2 n=1 Tax=Prorops nasuta TaxID=863751 RepID=UPI0034CFF38E
MPSLAIFRIEFDQISGTFSPGEFITGYVIIDLLKPKQVRGLQLLVKGEANTSWERRKWEQNSEGHADPEPVHYKGTEQYLLIKTYLVGNEGGDENVELPRGESTYPFSFQLPPNIPCSFEGEFGHVRYTVKAIIDRPWKYNHECKVAFTVITHLDLNEYSEKCMGVKDDILDNYSCCCVSIGTMKANIAIPVSCYVPGQTAEAVVGYEMCSRRVDIHRISLCLQQVAYFYAREPSNDSRSVTTILAKTDQTSNFQKRGKVFLKFMIPAAPPSELQFCGLIAVNYFLVVHINVSDFNSFQARGLARPVQYQFYHRISSRTVKRQ